MIRANFKKCSKLMIWAAASARYGKHELYVYPQHTSVNAKVYRKLMKRVIPRTQATFGRKQMRWQQDGAPAHTARLTTTAMEEMKVDVMDWPPNSADLSPIENVFSLLKNNIDAAEPETLDDLAGSIRKVWRELDNDWMKALMRSFPDRLRQCVERQGGATGN